MQLDSEWREWVQTRPYVHVPEIGCLWVGVGVQWSLFRGLSLLQSCPQLDTVPGTDSQVESLELRLPTIGSNSLTRAL